MPEMWSVPFAFDPVERGANPCCLRVPLRADCQRFKGITEMLVSDYSRRRAQSGHKGSATLGSA